LLDSASTRIALPCEAADTVTGHLPLHEAGVWVLVQTLHGPQGTCCDPT
jgi:hypothetical protein